MQVVFHVLALMATSHSLAIQSVFACVGLVYGWWSIWGPRQSARTTSKKFQWGGHLMVPLWPVGHVDKCDTILASVGWYHSLRSMEATSVVLRLLWPCPVSWSRRGVHWRQNIWWLPWTSWGMTTRPSCPTTLLLVGWSNSCGHVACSGPIRKLRKIFPVDSAHYIAQVT